MASTKIDQRRLKMVNGAKRNNKYLFFMFDGYFDTNNRAEKF